MSPPTTRDKRRNPAENAKARHPSQRSLISLSMSRSNDKEHRKVSASRGSDMASSATKKLPLSTFERNYQGQHPPRRSLPSLSMVRSKKERRPVTKAPSIASSTRDQRPTSEGNSKVRNPPRRSSTSLSMPQSTKEHNTVSCTLKNKRPSRPLHIEYRNAIECSRQHTPNPTMLIQRGANEPNLAATRRSTTSISANSSSIFKPFAPLFSDSSSPSIKAMKKHTHMDRSPASQRQTRSIASTNECTNRVTRPWNRAPTESNSDGSRIPRRNSFQIRNSITRNVRRVIRRKAENKTSHGPSHSGILSRTRRESSRF